MSCRQTPGNDLATSLTRWLSGAREGVVNSEFHAIRRSVKNTAPEPTVEAVKAFLARAREITMTDPRVPVARRQRLFDLMASVRNEVEQGHLPDSGYFAAWGLLLDRASDLHVKPVYANLSADGQVVTRDMLVEVAEELSVARTDREHLRTRGVWEGYASTYEEALDRVTEKVAGLEKEFRRLVFAYDTTDEGFHRLVQGHIDDTDISVSLTDRLAIARTARGSADPNTVRVPVPRDVILDARAHLADAYRQMKDAVQQHSGAADARTRFEDALAHYQNVLLGDDELMKVTDIKDLHGSVHGWMRIHGDSDIPRKEKWDALEAYAKQVDAREVDAGLLNAARARKNAERRAANRKSAEDFLKQKGL